MQFLKKLNKLSPGRRLDKLAPSSFFIFTATLFGFLFLILTPPFQGGDEPLHFYRAYQISNFNLIVDKNEGNDSGGNLPFSLQTTVMYATNNSQLGNLAPNEKYNHGKTKQALTIPEKENEQQWTNFTATALYPPVAYIPQATGILLARLLDLPPILMMYAGRLTNLAAWIALIAISINLIPRKKWAMAFVGLLPVAISQGASLSADVMTVGLFAVFLAWVLSLIDRRTAMSGLELGAMATLMGVMTLCKQIMIVFLPLLILVPNRLFGSKRRAYIIKISFILLAALLYLAWQYLIRDLDLKSVFSRGQNPEEQISFVLHQPLSFINALWNTHFFSEGDKITRSFIGMFGWGDTAVSEAISTIGYIILFLVLVINPVPKIVHWISGREKVLMALIGVAYAVAVSAALYAYYNPVGYKIIKGIQGRYLLPLGILAVPLLNGNWLKTSPRTYRKLVVFGPLFLLTASLVTIVYRYYIGNPV